MGIVIAVPLLAALTILQSSIVNNLTLLDGRPDLILLAVIAWGLTGRSRDSMVWGLIGGLMLDALSGFPFGMSSIILISLAYLVSLLEHRFWEAHFLMPLGVTLMISLLYHGLHAATLWVIGQPMDIGALYRIILPSTFLNILLSLHAVQLAKAIHALLYPAEVQI